MQIAYARVLSSEEVYPTAFVMWLSAPLLTRAARAGQFVMVGCSDSLDPLLPRPMSYHRFRVVNGERQMALLFDVRGRGTHWLSLRQPGDEVRLFGPLGRGYSVRPDARNLLLVAGGIGVAALVALMDQAVAEGRSVTLLYGVRTAERMLPLDLLPPEVEVVLASDDGSVGRRGLVTDMLADYLPWADQVFACGPNPMFQAMAAVVRSAASRKPVQVLLEERMACGLGICYSCAAVTRQGVRLVCRDGPRFDLRQVY